MRIFFDLDHFDRQSMMFCICIDLAVIFDWYHQPSLTVSLFGFLINLSDFIAEGGEGILKAVFFLFANHNHEDKKVFSGINSTQ